MNKCILPVVVLVISLSATAQESEVADMSDPLAIYTQGGVGFSDKGINLKLGKAYDTGDPSTAAQYVIEAKGLLGDWAGWRSDSRTKQSLDSVRFRNFNVTLPTMQASQIDVNYSFRANAVADESADISYSFIKALPPTGAFTFYPLAGLGASIGKDRQRSSGQIDDGYGFMGVYGLIGMYSLITITDSIWLNYNPFWLTTIGGNSYYKDNYYGIDESHLLTHELALSYQISPRMNVRLFANWNENVDLTDGDHRIEFNYQF